MSVSSAVDICNLALDYLNQSPIVDIENPTTNTEALCARWYDTTRKEALRRHPWNFAATRAQLAANSTPPLFGYELSYNLPSDYIRLMHINESILVLDSPIPSSAYTIEGGMILIGSGLTATGSSANTVNLVYASDFKAVPQMDASFIDYFSTLLAFKLAYKVTNSNTTVERMRTLMGEAESRARSMDGQENPPKRVERSRNRRARRKSGSNRNAGVIIF